MLENIYGIIEEKQMPQGFQVRVKLNPQHVIYQAHFPGNPITPGVCILQMCQELIERNTGRTLQMVNAKNIKFLNILSPQLHPEPLFTVEYTEIGEGIKASVTLSDEVIVFAKISVEYHGYNR